MDVVFAVLPFADVSRPAIGVSLLKAEIERLGFSATVQYFNMDLAGAIGLPLYTFFSNTLPSDSLAGEWFFADVLFGEAIPHEQEYFRHILSTYAQPALIGDIQKARIGRREYIENCARQIAVAGAPIVGFTTTFHQSCACLAVAKRLSEMPNPPIIVFGGANCEGEMGQQLLRSFKFIDYVCTREGDVVFPAFVERYLREGNSAGFPGFLRQGEDAELTTPALVENLDGLPIPDYREFVTHLAESKLAGEVKPELLIETSRGCWWGAKQHCTFCGLNGDTMRFRSKSAGRVFDELSFLSETYAVKRIDCVDNILDMKYIHTLFPRLQASGLDLELFYEVKANLRYEQVAQMRAGGVRVIQPGIESFSNEVLRLMKKGCTGLQNIQLLRWCEETGVLVAWNILAGFPGEAPEEYERTAKLLPLLTHLQPPTSCSPIRLDRFSPFFTRQQEFKLRRVRPTSAYYYVYPLGRRELSRIAYFFDFDYVDGRNPNSYLVETKKEVQRWRQAQSEDKENRPRLTATWSEEGLAVTDTRACAVRQTYQLTGLRSDLYLACDSAQSSQRLARRWGGRVTLGEVERALAELQDDKLLIEMEGQYLSLAVWTNRQAIRLTGEMDAYAHLPDAAAAEPLLHIV